MNSSARWLSRALVLSAAPLFMACNTPPSEGGNQGNPAASSQPKGASPSSSGANREGSQGEQPGTNQAAEEPKGLLAVGAEAPAITATAHDGEAVSLAALRGKPVIVYFYPKDDTRGCTIEAEQIRDQHEEFGKAEAVVLGVSVDNNESHSAFAEKYKLPFKLLPDTDHQIAKAFGVPLKNGYASRVTFIINKEGKIAKVFPDVNPDGHAKELLSALTSI